MACIIEPKLNQNGESVPWDPAQIPLTKPFVNIATTAYKLLFTSDDMRFVKTYSSIYSFFHKNTRKVNFEIGYSKNAAWFDSLSEKQSDYVYFFVDGFYEATYLTDENDSNTSLIQIDAKLIDFDARFRQTNPSTQSFKSPSSPSLMNNPFVQRKNKLSPSLMMSPPQKYNKLPHLKFNLMILLLLFLNILQFYDNQVPIQ